MKFNNTIALCKGFYKQRGDMDEFWKDMSHCIQVDGWSCYTKNEVAKWCLIQLDEFLKEFPAYSDRITFSRLFDKINSLRQLWDSNNENPLSESDYIIWAFQGIVRYQMSNDCFSEGVIPFSLVLPLGDGISSSLMYTEMFDNPKFKKQDLDYCFITYDKREEYINEYLYKK